MKEIVISAPALHDLIHALESNVERGAALFMNFDAARDRYLVYEVQVAELDDCIYASETEITFAPQFLTYITRRARNNGKSLGLLHTHPSGFSDFSAVDDRAEAGLLDFMNGRSGGRPCFAFVLCDGKLIARRFGTHEKVAVRVVGATIAMAEVAGGVDSDPERYDRQIHAFGEDGQFILQSLSVVIVGLGGTGSVVAQQLAHLGVEKFILFDDDTVEKTNLNRVVGANQESVGRTKVDVAAEMIRHINQRAEVSRQAISVRAARAQEPLRQADCIFICTDSHSSRAFLSEFAYQYLIPAFDIGVSINAREGKVEAVTGRTQMLAPGLACLWCSNAIDAGKIREELMSAEDRAADPYFNEGGIKQPAVISINSAMVSMAVSMFLGAFTAIPISARWQSYDALTGKVRLLASRSDPACGLCGRDGVTGAADSRELSLLEREGE
jgi:molybdopterin/thiamine biosynthesis adenylyltransferase